MKKSTVSTLLACVFFAGIFSVMLTAGGDSDVAAVRLVFYLVFTCALAIGITYWSRFTETKQVQSATAKFEHVFQDAEKFSQEYGDVYVLADRLKQQRNFKKGEVTAN